MKKLAFFLMVIFSNPINADIKEFNDYFISASSSVKPSVINIISYERKLLNGKYKLSKISYGTGTIISKNGFVVTNYHVVKKGNFYKAILSDGKSYDLQLFDNGKYYVSDYKTDIAVLKLDNSDGSVFYPVKIADSNLLQEGEWVLAIGNPYGLKQSITAGIVSSKGRDNIGFTDIEDFIQSDVSINPGNSGGPLINLRGEMVGLNTAIRSGTGGFQGISFAIPSSIVRQVCYELIEFGRVRRGWLGLIAREREHSYNTESRIVEIVSVIKNSPSDIAGLRQGDIIKEVDGIRIDSLGNLTKVIGNKRVASKTKIVISRDGKIFDIFLTLREKEEHEKIQIELYNLFQLYGIEVDEDSFSGKIVVSYISPRSHDVYLEQGDVIISMNNKKIDTIEDFIDCFKKSRRIIDSLEIMRDSNIFRINLSGKNKNLYE